MSIILPKRTVRSDTGPYRRVTYAQALWGGMSASVRGSLAGLSAGPSAEGAPALGSRKPLSQSTTKWVKSQLQPILTSILEIESAAGAYTLPCSAQLEPFLTQNHTLNTPDTLYLPLNTPRTTPN